MIRVHALSATIAFLAFATNSLNAGDEPSAQRDRPALAPITKTTPDDLPDGIARFNGMIVGRLVKKDVEKGTFIVHVDAIPRVWENSRAENPKSIVGKNVEVGGVFGKWLDVLLLVKEGETLECEAKHDGGSRLIFPGELLRKTAPFEPSDYPELPEEFRGFRGAVAGKIVKKDPDTFELIVEVEKVLETSQKSRAKNPDSIAGKPMMLAGFWQRKEAYFGLQVGDRIEAGLRHNSIRSDHMNVGDFVRKVASASSTEGEPKPDSPDAAFPAGMKGFRGIMIGKLVSKDVEKGEFVFRAESVKRVWKQNAAKDLESCRGREFTVRGVEGKFLDVLVSSKIGDRLEVEAFHNRSDHLDFPGEWLLKIE